LLDGSSSPRFRIPWPSARVTYHGIEDGLDGSRIFPGDRTETLTNRLAVAISLDAIESSDYVLDLHCNSRDSILFNFIRWNQSEAARESVAISRAFGFTIMLSEAKRQASDSRGGWSDCSST